jgi:SAM-dependent methyltransferase
MAHLQQENFVRKVKANKPTFFKDKKVIDFGSLDINGNNKIHFSGGSYLGVDIGKGKNVDIVCKASEFKSEEEFDVVISTEMLEHDSDYVASLSNMYDVCKDGGLIILTAAGEGRPEHGTMRSDGGYSSPFTTDYYKNITEKELREAWDIEALFSEWGIEHNVDPYDIYFWGIKYKKVQEMAIVSAPKKRGRKPKS